MFNIIIGGMLGYYLGQKYSPSEIKEKTMPFLKQTIQSVKDMFQNN